MSHSSSLLADGVPELSLEIWLVKVFFSATSFGITPEVVDFEFFGKVCAPEEFVLNGI